MLVILKRKLQVEDVPFCTLYLRCFPEGLYVTAHQEEWVIPRVSIEMLIGLWISLFGGMY